MSEAKPFPKTQQLARGERRYRRKVASPKQWQAIIAAKGKTCRIAWLSCDGPIQYHHLLSRAQGGDDVADNIVPLCAYHHAKLARAHETRMHLAAKLTDAEYAYVVGKLGEGGMERLFGVGRS